MRMGIAIALVPIFAFFANPALCLERQAKFKAARTLVEREIQALDEEIARKKEDLLSVWNLIFSELVLIGLPLCDFIITDRVPGWRFAADIGAMLLGGVIFTQDRIKRDEIAELKWKKRKLEAKLASLMAPEPEVVEKSGKKKLPPLELLTFSRSYLPRDYRTGRYSDAVMLNLVLRNNTDKTIKAWRCFLVVKGLSGEVLFEFLAKDDMANIVPSSMTRVSFRWEDDPLQADEPFDKLVSEEVIRVDLEKVELVTK